METLQNKSALQVDLHFKNQPQFDVMEAAERSGLWN